MSMEKTEMSWTGPPLSIARQMWDCVSTYEWRPGEFRSLFDKLYNDRCDLETLWQLGGALNDYLRKCPGELNVPPELPRKLLVSLNVDARIIGLKLLNRANVETSEIVEAIVNALRAPDEYGDYSGLYETGNLISRCENERVRLSRDLTDDLIAALQTYSANRDDIEQDANRHIEGLREISS